MYVLFGFQFPYAVLTGSAKFYWINEQVRL